MLREPPKEIPFLILAADVLVAALGFGIPAALPGMIRAGAAAPDILRLVGLGLAASLVWPFAFARLGLYSAAKPLGVEPLVARLVAAGFVAGALQGVATWLLRAPVAPIFPALCALAQFGGLAVLRLSVHAALRWLHRAPETRNVLIVGSGPRAAYVERVIDQHPAWNLRIVGFIDDGAPEGGASVAEERLHKLPDLVELLREHVIDGVIVACPRSMLASITTVVDTCAAAGVPITLLSDLFGDYLPPPVVMRFGTLPALTFAPVHHDPLALAVKRGLDVVGALVGLVLAAPILAAAAAAIKLTSPGPVWFRQIRCGLHGRRFEMRKLRTMGVDAEARRSELEHLNEMNGPVFKLRSDPRVTPVGRLLRRFSLDELPQLFDVLRGHMSLVGPRPSLPSEVADYRTFERRRLSMRPGLTCLWQVSGRNEIGFDDWVRLDLEYIDTWSLAGDLRILLRTLPAVLGGRGAS
jgi:exopolysaccharide biosynthesis polyprenyl glycosylphosphotransferase